MRPSSLSPFQKPAHGGYMRNEGLGGLFPPVLATLSGKKACPIRHEKVFPFTRAHPTEVEVKAPPPVPLFFLAPPPVLQDKEGERYTGREDYERRTCGEEKEETWAQQERRLFYSRCGGLLALLLLLQEALDASVFRGTHQKS